jgi:hypothetical protein
MTIRNVTWRLLAVRDPGEDRLAREATISIQYESGDFEGYVGGASIDVWVPAAVADWYAIEQAAAREARALLTLVEAALARRDGSSP